MREIINRLLQIDGKKPELAGKKQDIIEECSYIMK